jgi:hypothetical protein
MSITIKGVGGKDTCMTFCFVLFLLMHFLTC